MRSTPKRRACSSSSSQLDAAASPTTSSSALRSTTSSAWVPIEPVDPTMTILRTRLSLGAGVQHPEQRLHHARVELRPGHPAQLLGLLRWAPAPAR